MNASSATTLHSLRISRIVWLAIVVWDIGQHHYRMDFHFNYGSTEAIDDSYIYIPLIYVVSLASYAA